jgi:hypothetical protein
MWQERTIHVNVYAYIEVSNNNNNNNNSILYFFCAESIATRPIIIIIIIDMGRKLTKWTNSNKQLQYFITLHCVSYNVL